MSGIEQDIVAVGLDLKPETLVKAYSNGIFPWPTPGYPMLWYCPKRRAVLDFENLHVGKRLHQYLKTCGWTFTVSRSFPEVIEACAERGDEGTWITDEMKSAYLKMHSLGHAHSIEVWDAAKTSRSGESHLELIGGLYGVDVGGTFAGESMFHKKDNASKAAVLFVAHLLRTLGRDFLDIQVLTPHMEALGATEISRTKFLKRIERIQLDGFEEMKKISSNQIWEYDPKNAGSFIERSSIEG